ncbi:hypothetical protein BDV96DRAFT_558783 [Lophiotrema nucula]|uniref:Nucleotide-diphospho-sugar transferase n=1 Tax=Lophiotrema nucula TaxID=690887 RepID=A0A6A5YKA9_9PLEO|nr:hypothetical protein BDV96DRAFT_558783 [Lophiotrema nucula]
MFSNAVVPSRRIINILAAVFILFVLVYLFPRDFTSQDAHVSPHQSAPTKRYAYATFLGGQWDANDTSINDDGKHFTQTRMLLWQLKHDPGTRSPNNYPFLVLVTKEVTQSKREQLKREGAIVKEVAQVVPPGHEKGGPWVDMVTRVRMFEMIEYDKVMYLSPDHLITRPVDGIFEDTAAQLQQNRKLTSKGATKPAEAPQPSTYIFASTSSAGDFNHKLPPPRGLKTNGDCLLYKPSKELFNYYVSLATLKAKGSHGAYPSEEPLWNYAHRRKGNMPWTQLHWKWNIDWVSYKDYEAGIASLNVKYWDIPEGDTELGGFANDVKRRMEEYWLERGDEKA